MENCKIIVENLTIEVKQPNRFQLEEYFQKSARNMMLANRNLLISLAVDPDAARTALDADPALAMSVSAPLADLIGIKEAFLLKPSQTPGSV